MTLIYAKFVNPEAGYNKDNENASILTEGEFYEVEGVSMGQSNTSIYLKNLRAVFNSVQFEFYDEQKKAIDIFSMPEFNPYLKMESLMPNKDTSVSSEIDELLTEYGARRASAYYKLKSGVDIDYNEVTSKLKTEATQAIEQLLVKARLDELAKFNSLSWKDVPGVMWTHIKSRREKLLSTLSNGELE